MKICQIIYTYPPHVTGGADIYAERISKELSEKGNELVVITTKPYDGLSSLKPSFEMEKGIKVYRFYPMNIYSWINSAEKSLYQKMFWNALDIWNLHAYLVIKNILKKEKPDVVHIHTPIWISLSVFDAVKSLNIPIIFTVHDYLLLCRRTLLLHTNGEVCSEPRSICKWYQGLSRKIVDNKPDMVLAPSQFILNMLTANGFFQEAELVTLPLGTELKDGKVEKNYETIDILYAGSLIGHKGVDVLIRTFKNLKQKNIRLHILGKGADQDVLEELARDDKRISFHGFVEGGKLTGFYQKANVTVVPSVCFDNSPLVVYESFMNGTPVIGSRIGGIPELIEEGYNGFLFDTGNVTELENILQNLIENPSKLKSLEKGAFESRKKYDMKVHIEKLEKIYKGLIASKGVSTSGN
jgi:glycosyltransferase involved in cell wall biosynthesis